MKMNPRLSTFTTLILLGGASVVAFFLPITQWDVLPYMRLVLLYEGVAPRESHALVYKEAARFPKYSGLASDTARHKLLATSLEDFDMELPYRSIRPGYITILRWVHLLGFSLVDSIRLVSAVSYFSLGLVVFLWLKRYVTALHSVAGAMFVMLSAPMFELGRSATPDALSAFMLLSAMLLMFETDHLTLGLGLLLSSLYIRTDNVIFGLALLGLLVLTQRLQWWKAAVLAGSGVVTVLMINRLAGNYGWAALIHATYPQTMQIPGEEVARVSPRAYLLALRHSIPVLYESHLYLSAFLGATAVALFPRHRMAKLVGTIALATLARYVLFPTWELRFYALFTLVCLLGFIAVIGEQIGSAGIMSLRHHPRDSNAEGDMNAPVP
jgi:hypothetical protein